VSRTNIYAEEISDRVEIIEKETADGKFTGLRIYLELPVTVRVCRLCGMLNAPGSHTAYCRSSADGHTWEPRNVSGPFMHRPGDDDSSAVTFWGKSRLREVLKKALALLDAHYEKRGKP
jgi:hypothetical protein